ncbi:MAG TPA: hypothetical protein VJX29_00955 [Candidatus Acidoferrales bacterium]|nr:hypothetical protein [Candidatus Acidoferrales bacterium]
MPRRSADRFATLGFRVKTGRAILVALAGPAANPQILFHREVQLCDPNVPESRQPYHGGIMPFVPATPQAVARGRKAAERTAVAVITALSGELHAAGYSLAGVALVLSSNPDLARIGSSHIRAHALEGILFREVLEAGARAASIPASLVLEREALARASRALRRPEARLQRALAGFGAQAGRPWRAGEKSAALGAWLALSM